VLSYLLPCFSDLPIPELGEPLAEGRASLATSADGDGFYGVLLGGGEERMLILALVLGGTGRHTVSSTTNTLMPSRKFVYIEKSSPRDWRSLDVAAPYLGCSRSRRGTWPLHPTPISSCAAGVSISTLGYFPKK
jgi:hypothetical protein